MEKTYTAAELANEWGLTAEGVRKYLRRIKEDEALQNMDLIRIDGRRTLITEAGREWIERERAALSGYAPAEEEPAPLPENSDDDADLLAKVQEQAAMIAELQRQADRDQMQIGFLETQLQTQEQNAKKTEMLLRTELDDWKQQAQKTAVLALNAQRLIETKEHEEKPASALKTASESKETGPIEVSEEVEEKPGKLRRIWRIITGQE